MSKLRNTLLGATVGLGLHAGIASNVAEAKDAIGNVATQKDFPMQEYFDRALSGHEDDSGSWRAERDQSDAVATLLDNIPVWAAQDGAEVNIEHLAREFPYHILHHAQEILDSHIPWGPKTLRTAMESISPDSDSTALFADLDVSRADVFNLLEGSMETMYGNTFFHYWYKQALEPHEQRLLLDALHVEAVKDPLTILTQVWGDQERFVQQVPTAKEREHILDEAVLNAINTNQESLRQLIAFADISPDIRKTIARTYGWDRFLEHCSEQVPDEVLRSLQDGKKTFLMLTFEKKRMELYRNAAQRAPLSLILEWPLTQDRKLLLTKAEEEEFNALVNQAFYDVLANTSANDEQLNTWWISPENLAQFPGITRGLAYRAEHTPLQLLLMFGNQETADVTQYREIAAHKLIQQRIWTTGAPNGNTTLTLLAGLPDEDNLKREWFEGAIIDIPYQAFPMLLQESPRKNWFPELERQALIFSLDKGPEPFEDELKLTRDISFPELQLLLGAQAKDNFPKAARASAVLFLQHHYDAYQLLFILEQSQPYEFAHWIQTQNTQDWQSRVTPEQWESLKIHATHIEADQESYASLAESIAQKGFRFNARTLEDLNGMNYHHRLYTTIDEKGYPGGIAGKNFISIPMIAFEAVATMSSFNTYIDTHADGQLSFVNLCSMAQATFRRLRDLHLPITDDNVTNALKEIDSQWEKAKNTEIIGPNTKLIVASGDETRFSSKAIIDELFIGHGGDAKNVRFSGTGPKDKPQILQEIGRNTSGATTILLDGHGTKDAVYLSDSVSISVSELGEMIAFSHNAPNIRLILNGCSGYDFADNLLKFLRTKNVDTTGMIIISDTNFHALAFGGGKKGIDSGYLSVVNEQNPGMPITLQTFKLVEHKVWLREDPSITLGLPLSAGWMTGIEVVDERE